MELKINIENILSSIIAGYILFLITKNHSNARKSGFEIRFKLKNLEFKLKSSKRRK